MLHNIQASTVKQDTVNPKPVKKDTVVTVWLGFECTHDCLVALRSATRLGFRASPLHAILSQ